MNNEELILYRLDELAKKVECLQSDMKGQSIEMAEVKTLIATMQEDITELKSFVLPKKKNGNGTKIEEKRYEYLLSLLAITGSLIALIKAFIGGGK
jgi:uncharacterized small protein (DUF1192 family)|uniref:Uncharacterized protein n=1 Tax=candidate division CPR3 bacterium TaxID=2268181 RepID=A0A7C5YZ13_UNCC3